MIADLAGIGINDQLKQQWQEPREMAASRDAQETD
jgi:hypothetical protein